MQKVEDVFICYLYMQLITKPVYHKITNIIMKIITLSSQALKRKKQSKLHSHQKHRRKAISVLPLLAFWVHK